MDRYPHYGSLDVPSVGAIILAGVGKAETSLRQRIGIELRRKKSAPNVDSIVDLSDGYNIPCTGTCAKKTVYC